MRPPDQWIAWGPESVAGTTRPGLDDLFHVPVDEAVGAALVVGVATGSVGAGLDAHVVVVGDPDVFQERDVPQRLDVVRIIVATLDGTGMHQRRSLSAAFRAPWCEW